MVISGVAKANAAVAGDLLLVGWRSAILALLYDKDEMEHLIADEKKVLKEC